MDKRSLYGYAVENTLKVICSKGSIIEVSWFCDTKGQANTCKNL